MALNTTTAGAKTGTATLGFTSTEINGSGLGTISIGSQLVTATGSVYQAAQAAILPSTVNFGIVHVGDTVVRNIGVTNSAPATGGFTETLGATGTTASPHLTLTGSATGVGAGATLANAITVGLNTATAGSISGATARFDYTSEALAGSGLTNLSAGSQTVTFNGQVNNYAAFGLRFESGEGSLVFTGANAATLDFGVLNLGDASANASLLFGNTATGPADTLALDFATSGGAFLFTGFTSVTGIAAGESVSAVAAFNPANTGTWSQNVSITLRSQNSDGFNGSLGDFNLMVTGTVVPEPSTYAAVLGAAALAAVLLRRKKQNRKTPTGG